MSEQQTELDQDVSELTTVITDVATQTGTLGTDLAAVAAGSRRCSSRSRPVRRWT